MICLKDVSKIYNQGKANETQALQHVTLTIKKGDMVAITGPSGSGKSTLLHIIAGIDAQTSGVYEYDGNDVRKMSDRGKCELRNKKIGIILQDFGLLGNDTVLRNICLPEIIAGTYKKSFDKKVRVLLQQVGLEGLEHKKVNQLSGGQRQRVAICRALAMDAEVIVADEPTGALDSRSTDEMLRLFSSINDSGQTILMVTHSVKAASHAGRVLFIRDGEVFHQIYRGEMDEEAMYAKISDTLKLLQKGGRDE